MRMLDVTSLYDGSCVIFTMHVNLAKIHISRISESSDFTSFLSLCCRDILSSV